MKKHLKYIVITGGVISWIGKWVAGASVGFFLSEHYKITPIKLDGYLNVDPGTMNPKEHGEVFVLKDGAEVDMDFGHYERFLGQDCQGFQSITMGKIFKEILEKERKWEYLGSTVQFIPHVTDCIQERIEKIATEWKSDICLIEVGGTVGDIESELYVEAIRQLRLETPRHDFLHIHLTYVPIPHGVNEQKTKPTQQSIQLLQARGLVPDIIFARGEQLLTESSKKKIALFANLSPRHIFSLPDVKSIYTIPEILREQGFGKELSCVLKLEKFSKKKGEIWNKLLASKPKKQIHIGIVGKYTMLEDSYGSVIEAIKHASFHFSVEPKIHFVNTREKNFDVWLLSNLDAIIVPGGFGKIGIEPMIQTLQYARENKIPTLGICLGLQLMMIEYFRNIGRVKKANSREFDEKTKYDVITLLDSQANIVELGGTMRLGWQRSILKKSTIEKLYKEAERIDKDGMITERFRHRYEVNPKYAKELEDSPLHIVGRSEKEGIVQFIEMDVKTHPYYVATQSHPELTSKLENPAPLFMGLVKASIRK